MINFAVSNEDNEVIMQIVNRAMENLSEIDGVSLSMDLCATHNVCPLKLEELLNADDFNFLHDIVGIMRHINRETGKLGEHFLPRFAANE